MFFFCFLFFFVFFLFFFCFFFFVFFFLNFLILGDMATRKRKREEEEDPRVDDSLSENDSLWEDDFALLATPSTPSTPSTLFTPSTTSKKMKRGKGDYPKKIFLLAGGGLGEEEEMIITKLPHPRTLHSVQFVVRGKRLFEIQQVAPERLFFLLFF